MTRTNIDSMLVSAISQLGPIKSRIYNRMLKSPRFKDTLVDQIVLQSYDKAFCTPAIVAMFGEPDFDSSRVFEIDPDNFKKWIDWLVKNLPTIISIILAIL